MGRVFSRNGQITTTDIKIDHYPFPCPPAREEGVSCDEAWDRYAQQTGLPLVRQQEERDADS